MVALLTKPTAQPTRSAQPDAAGDKTQPARIPLVPFSRAARERTEPADDRTITLGTSAVQSPQIDVPSHGYMRHLVLLVEATGGAAGGNNAVAQEDAPFSVLDEIRLDDVSGNPIFGPYSGYQCYLANKYGAYAFVTDPKQLPSYSAVATSGNFTFTLRVPVEVSGRDGLGALPNQNAGQTYKLSYSVGPRSNVYSTVPDTVPSIRVRTYLESWTQPLPSDELGNPQETAPPQEGTTQFWTRTPVNVAAGQQNVRVTRVGNYLRAIIAIFETTAGARSTTNWPDPLTLSVDGNVIDNIARSWMVDRMVERYGLTAAEDAAGGRDKGVMVWDFAHDLDGKPGFEERDNYLPTTGATLVQISGSFGAAGTVTVLVNDVAPA